MRPLDPGGIAVGRDEIHPRVPELAAVSRPAHASMLTHPARAGSGCLTYRARFEGRRLVSSVAAREGILGVGHFLRTVAEPLDHGAPRSAPVSP